MKGARVSARSAGARSAPATASPYRRVGLACKCTSKAALTLAQSLESALRRRGLEVLFDTDTAAALGRGGGLARERLARSVDLVIVVGGDGTLLSVARAAPTSTPVLGINVGVLGFLAGLSRNEALTRLDEVLAGEFREDRRRRLEVTVTGPTRTRRFRALNDAVLNKEALARISTFRIDLDGRSVAEFRADGVIVATPTGSTAYNLSAGGPILHPQLPAVVITPICPHTLSQRPLVVPSDTVIGLRILDPHRRPGGVYLTLDGQEGLPIGPESTVEVRSGASPVTLLRPPEADHFENLAEKLNWGI
ncbi:MAG TPA: NAD(+)/NADH kinase [Thermoanaerobaculia bacterium]|jgi:NAD+ kinase|nr:NAD(+)/NADH kinase [Thermoanaerobaculia bacterium]